MNKVILAIVAMMFSINVMALPNGKPFIEIDGEIIELQDQLADLQEQVDGILVDVTDLEGQVAALTIALADLSVDVVANADAIAFIEIRLEEAELDLELKQNIVNGICPDGQAMISVNVGENDGQIVCAETGGTQDLQYVTAFKWGSPTRVIGKIATCPVGYKATGGGAAWLAGIRSSMPHQNGAGWIAYGSAGTGGGLAMFTVSAVCLQ